jgi:hypothetical protein
MENSLTPKGKSVSLPSAARCWKTYDYAAWSATGFIVAGRLTLHPPLGIKQATIYAGQEAAKTAYELDFPFDPFNMQIAVKPIKRKPKK